MTEYRLGKGITRIVTFHRIRDDKEHTVPIKKPKEIFTTKLVITMVVIAVVKIAVLLLWTLFIL